MFLTIIDSGSYHLVVLGTAQAVFPGKANGSLSSKDSTVIGSALVGQNFSDPRYVHPRPSAAGNGYVPTSSDWSNLAPTSAKLLLGTTKQSAPPTPPAGAPVAAAASAAQAAGTPPAAAPAAATTTPAAPLPLVVDNDGITLRVLHYCDDKGIPFEAKRNGHAAVLALFKPSDDWDEVELITAFNDADHPLSIKTLAPIAVDAVTISGSGLDPHISEANALLQASRVDKARGLSDVVVRTLIAQVTEHADFGIFGDPGINVLRLNIALDAQH